MRSAALVLLAVGLALVLSASSAVRIGSTECSVDVRARNANLDWMLAAAGGALSLGGSPTITRGVSGRETAALAYDGAGRLVRAEVGGGVTSYRYDDAGRLSALVDPNGEITMYEYDSLGRVVAAGDSTFAYSDQGLFRAIGGER